MGEAKNITLRPISRRDADMVVKRVHYSGKVVNNSQIHIGIFYNGKLEGALQFGPSLDKRKLVGLVEGTKWLEFIELNRLALSEALPRNSESRALAVSMRLLRKHAPQLKWVVSFADATQCGDGTIYRAAGFVLTGCRKNTQVWVAPDGTRFSRTSLTDGRSKAEQRKARATVSRISLTKSGYILGTGGASMKPYKENGFVPMPGYQLRYIYFLDPTARERLTVPVIPFDKIPDDARMYRGEKLICAGSVAGDAATNQVDEGGSIPTPAL